MARPRRYVLASSITVFSVVDWALTRRCIKSEECVEANPLMEPLVAYPLFFSIMKLVIIPVVAFLLTQTETESRIGLWGLVIGYSAYALVVLWHVVGLEFL